MPTRNLVHGYTALRHAVTPRGLRGVFRADVRKAGLAVPLRVGAAVTVVFVVGGLIGQRDVAGFAALGALVSAFCRPDPYPIRVGRLAVLAVGITTAIGIGAALGTAESGVLVEAAVISLLAGAAAYLMWALHIVGPGAVVFVFGAAGGHAFAHDASDVVRAVAVTACGAVIGVIAALAPWLYRTLRRSVSETTGSTAAHRETLWLTLTRAPHRALLARSARLTAAGAAAAAVAIPAGLEYPMWATMGAVATMQGVGYHVTVHRGIQRLLGNVGGAVIAAALLALPLGYWGAVVAIVVFQTLAEIAATVNYALTSLAVTPMALLLTGLGSSLTPAVALDRVLDTAVGIVIGIVIAALTISGHEVEQVRKAAAGR
ncbi:FUSC family protein [Mycobacterium goodii]|nr:FUSC family protein [Mycolicibacterium goodii]